eukprot:1757224-Amphidinium_carterae.1
MLCLRILQACKQGDFCSATAQRAKHGVPVKLVKGKVNLRSLSNLILEAREKVLRDELESCMDPATTTGSRLKDNSWHCRMYGLWRQQRLLPHPSLERSDFCPNCPADEVTLLSEHWGPIFSSAPMSMGQVADIVGDDLLEDVLSFVPQIPWERVEVNVERIETVLLEARSSAAGPDEVTYAMLKPLAPSVAAIACDWFCETCASASLPVQLAETSMVFIPKLSSAATVGPNNLRPISLLNT